MGFAVRDYRKKAPPTASTHSSGIKSVHTAALNLRLWYSTQLTTADMATASGYSHTKTNRNHVGAFVHASEESNSMNDISATISQTTVSKA